MVSHCCMTGTGSAEEPHIWEREKKKKQNKKEEIKVALSAVNG